MIRRVVLSLSVLLVAAGTASAQRSSRDEVPKVEVYGTYQLFRADIDVLDNESLQGWGAGVQGNFNKWFGAVAEINGAYGSSNFPVIVGNTTVIVDAKTNVYTYLFGPRVSYRAKAATMFGHALFGFSTLTIGLNDCATCSDINNNNFAMAFGGGVDVNVSRRLAIRAGQFDYVPIHTDLPLNGGDSNYFRNVRFQAGLVFKF